jgi:hypothetical protein
MRCPACQTENADGATACVNCQAPLAAPKRRSRRRGDSADEGPLSAETEAYNREVLLLYRWSLYAVIPVAGLVMGPLVVYRALRVRKKAAADPRLAGAIPVGVAFWVGLISGVTSWLGLALMALGLLLG